MKARGVSWRLLSAAALVIGLNAVLFGLAPHQVQAFGKNKINYDTFKWRFHETPHFRIHYYEESYDLVLDIEDIAENAYAMLSGKLDHELSFKVPLIMYRTHRHMEQTNIILDFIPEGVAGFNEPIKNRLVVPVQLPKNQLVSLITHELVHSFQFDILFGSRLGQLPGVPLWIMEGMAEHFTGDWDAIGRMVLKDAVANGYVVDLADLETFNRLYSPYLGYKLAQSAVDYIVETYGIMKFRNFLWEVRRKLPTERFTDRASRRAFGISLAELSQDWRQHLNQKYAADEVLQEFPSEYGRPMLAADRRVAQWIGPVVSPGGQQIAFVTGYKTRSEVMTVSWPAEDEPVDGALRAFQQTARIPECLTCDIRPWKFLYVITKGRPLTWSAEGDYIAFFGRVENENRLFVYDVVAGSLSGAFYLPVDVASSPSFMPDGRIAFAGYKDYISDIFAFDPATKEVVRLTKDDYLDETPAVSPDGGWLAYASERGDRFRIIMKDLATKHEKMITTGAGNELLPQWSPSGNRLLFISDAESGINNVYTVDLRSGEVSQHTDAFAGITSAAFENDENTLLVSCFVKGRERLYRIPLDRVPKSRRADAAKLRQLRDELDYWLRLPNAEGPGGSIGTDGEIPADSAAPSTDEVADAGDRNAPLEPQAGERDDSGQLPPAADDEVRSAEGDMATEATGEPAGAAAAAEAESKASSETTPGAAPEAAPEVAAETATQTASEAETKTEAKLRAPQERKVPFKLLPDAIDAQVTYSSDGVLRLIGGIMLSDMLGNHRIYLEASRYTGTNNLLMEYYFLRFRPDFGLRLYSLEDYYYYFGRYERQIRGGSLFATYPLNITHRFTVQYNYIERADDNPVYTSTYDVSLIEAAFVADSVIWASYGGHKGRRYAVSYAWPLVISNQTLDFDVAYADYREYLPLSRRSEVALHLFGIRSSGEEPEVSYIGGAGTIRGYEYGEFYGTRAAYANVELRFPLLDVLAFPAGIMFYGIRGALYVDSGIAWFEGEDIDLFGTREGPDAPLHLNSAVGFGITWDFLGLELHFDFSKRTDFRKFEGDTIYEFSIRRNF
ncbi:PD40 domain-containing protein [bacterium]|nr:PD40 domain-containing protein [candidate division CSSED10-310 bacterium]